MGGTSAGSTNIISGNTNNGVHIQGSSGTNTSNNTIEGNLIGTNTSDLLLGDNVGVLVDNGAAGNTIGAGNVIAFNSTAGIDINGIGSASTSNNVVVGSFIGTDPTGMQFLPNEIGVLIDVNATNNIVGGSLDQKNVISSNVGPGVEIRGSEYYSTEPPTGNTVAGNFIGTDSSGEYVSGVGDASLGNPIGVLVESGAINNTIGGLNELNPDGTVQLRQGNLISGNTTGVEISGSGNYSLTSGNVVEGNFIGTDLTGKRIVDFNGYLMGNGTGVLIMAGAYANSVGGSVSSARNLISGNFTSGVEINGSGLTPSYENIVEGNYIGTDITGTLSLGNPVGVLIDSGAHDNTVGGLTSSARNVISGNTTAGVDIAGGTVLLPEYGNEVEGNLIGTDASGTTAVPNLVGVTIEGVANLNTVGNTVGGLTSSARNVISGNTTGVDIAGVSFNEVEGNLIGTDASGTTAVPNNVGVTIEGVANFNTVGGLTSSARNVISGNTTGVVINGNRATNNCLEGNYVGTDVDGGIAITNEKIGVLIEGGASGNTVGGITNAAQTSRNIISGNATTGVEILGFLSSTGQVAVSTSGNCVEGNYIGIDQSGTSAVGNNIGLLLSNAPNNTIGGTDIGAGNVISGNTSYGVQIIGLGSTNEQLIGNFIGPDASGDNALPPSAIKDPTKAVQQTGILIDGSIGNDIGEPGHQIKQFGNNSIAISRR